MRVILMMALTVDGKIGRDAEHFPDWTGPGDKRLFKELSTRAGAIIMGSKTYATLNKPLPNRLNVIMSRRTHPTPPWENLVYCADPPAVLLDRLAEKGYSEVILAGGATINTLFGRVGLIHEVHVTVSPLIFGQGLSLFNEPVDLPLKLISNQLLEGELLYCRYAVRHG